MKYKIKDTKALYVKKVENALYCDFCEERDVTVIELEDENETQICESCVSELSRTASKIFKT